MNLQHQSRRNHQTRICSLNLGFAIVPRRIIADRVFGPCPPGRSVFLAYQIEGFSLRIPLPLKALYFKDIGLIRKMLATQKDLSYLIQLTSCTIVNKPFTRRALLPTARPKSTLCGTSPPSLFLNMIQNVKHNLQKFYLEGVAVDLQF